MKNKLKWLVLSVFVLCLTLFSQSDVNAITPQGIGHKYVNVGFKFTYDTYSRQNYVGTDVFYLDIDGTTMPVFCVQLPIGTDPGNVYTEELVDTININAVSTRISDIMPIANDGSGLQEYLNDLTPKTKQNLAISYIWFLYHKDNGERSVEPAQAWFTWCITLGSSHNYLEQHADKHVTGHFDFGKIDNGYDYLDITDMRDANNRPHSSDGVDPKMWDEGLLEETWNTFNQIKDYVTSMDLNEKIDFNNKNIEVHPGNSVTITDNNGLLKKDEYTVSLQDAPAGVTAQKNGNSVTITVPSDFNGEWRGNLVVTRFDVPGNDGSNHFYGNGVGNQIVYKGGLPKTQTFTPVYVHSGKITVAKKDADTGNVAQGDATLKGAQFTIYTDKACTHAVETIATEKVGNEYIATSDWLKVGTYYVKETQPPTGYNLSDEVLTVTVDGSDHDPLFPKVQLANKVKRGKVHLNSAKTEEENVNTYYAIVKEDGTAEFFDEPWKAKHPDEECTIPYGTYTITEVDGGKGDSTHYFMDNIVEVNINDQGVERYYIVRENPPEPYLSIQKVDKFDGKPVKIAGAKYKIWDCKNNCWLRQPSQYGYSEEWETNSDGVFVTPQKVSPGKYVIYETKAPDGYYLDDEYRIPENPADYGDASKGGVEINIDKYAEEIEPPIEPDETTPDHDIYYKVKIANTVKKVQLQIEKKGEVLTDASQRTEIVGKETLSVVSPIYAEKNIGGAKYEIYAKEDILSPDGERVYVTEGTVVDTVTQVQMDLYYLQSYIQVYMELEKLKYQKAS